jgi:hypothetical protein
MSELEISLSQLPDVIQAGYEVQEDAIPDYEDDGYAEARESYNRQGLDLSYPQYLATYGPE